MVALRFYSTFALFLLGFVYFGRIKATADGYYCEERSFLD